MNEAAAVTLRFDTAARAGSSIDGAIEAGVNYLVPPLGRHRVTVMPLGQGQTPRSNGDYVATRVVVRDARAAQGAISLDATGFELARQALPKVDFNDDEAVRAAYYPGMKRLLRRAATARDVLVFDHNVRVNGGAASANSRVPVRVVHNDYTERSARQRVRDLLGDDEASALLNGRFAIINAWRSISDDVRSAPLGLIDAASVRPSDLVPTDLVYPDRVGEIYEVAGNPSHRWYYFPRLAEDEVLLIKGYDSRPDVARFTPHSAFDDPAAPVDAPPRRSIEIRALVLY